MLFLCFILSLFISLIGCNKESEDENDINEKDYAPEFIISKSMTFYNRIDHWTFKLMQGNQETPTVLIVNSTVYKIEHPDISYVKLSDNTAQIQIYFNAMTTIGGNIIGTHYEYNLKLIFKTAHQGEYIGVCKSGGIGELKSEDVSGYFVYDSDELPDPSLGNENNDINFSQLIGSWENRISATIVKQFFFNEDGTYIQKMTFNSEKVEVYGTYKIDKAKYTLDLYEKAASKPTSSLLVTKLTKDNLGVKIYDPILDKYNNIESYSRLIDTGEENVTLSSCTVSNITKSTVTISGIISKSNGVVLKETGICYSTSSVQPTIENDYKQKTSSGNINSNLEGLNEGSRYRVRLYAVTDKKTYYGNITTFETASDIKLEIKEISPNSILVKSTTTSKNNRFGICAGKSPHPTVTNISINEAAGETSWILKNLTKATTYYIRAYHVDGTNIKYFDESEISAATVGKDIHIYCEMNEYRKTVEEYDQYTFKVTYSLPQGIYELSVNTYSGKYNDDHSWWRRRSKGFVEGSNTIVSGGEVYNGAKPFFEVQLQHIETGIVYYSNVIYWSWSW